MSVLKDWSNLNIDDAKTKKEFDDMMGSYDTMIAEAGYELPQQVPHLLKGLPPEIQILDLCCGTGLVGHELITSGYPNVDGIDFSNNIEVAKSRGYKNVRKMNLNNLQPIEKDYDVVLMVGALTYFDDCSIIKKIYDNINFKHFLFSHRNDLLEPEFVDFLESMFRLVTIIPDVEYLPNSEHYKDIRVTWFACSL